MPRRRMRFIPPPTAAEINDSFNRLFREVLRRVCEDGRAAASADYIREEQAALLNGSLFGFDQAEGQQNAEELAHLYEAANADTAEAFREQDPNYWYWSGRRGEIEWCCNVLGGLGLMGEELAVVPTVRGFFKGREIMQAIVKEAGGETVDAIELADMRWPADPISDALAKIIAKASDTTTEVP
jgi:hypothetical protein